jgi:hypothetical protein
MRWVPIKVGVWSRFNIEVAPGPPIGMVFTYHGHSNVVSSETAYSREALFLKELELDTLPHY